jgi:hypothetical protein
MKSFSEKRNARKQAKAEKEQTKQNAEKARKAAAEEKRKSEYESKIDEIVATGNIAEASKYADLMTIGELSNTITKYEKITRLNQLVESSQPKKKSAIDYVNKIANGTRSIGNMIGASVTVARNVKQLADIFSDKDAKVTNTEFKDISQVSDKELEKANKRLNEESKYRKHQKDNLYVYNDNSDEEKKKKENE